MFRSRSRCVRPVLVYVAYVVPLGVYEPVCVICVVRYGALVVVRWSCVGFLYDHGMHVVRWPPMECRG